MEEVWNFWPAIAVPTMVKMPEPMTAPMPREVRLSQPNDFFNRNSAPSQSEMSWSMFLRRKSDEANRALRSSPARASDGNRMGMRCGKNVPREAEVTQPTPETVVDEFPII